MAHDLAQPRTTSPLRAALPLAIAASLMLGACASGPESLLSGNSMLLASSDDAPAKVSNQTELQKATEYWAKEYTQKPADKTAALSYARNLKALGQKQRALMVMQQASNLHGTNPEVASEYGRLALEFDQLTVAERMLQIADEATNPDWKVISARGTVLAKQGQYKAAIPFYERALTMAPNQPSIQNNLALAHAMSGDAPKAEGILRQAAASGGDTKINQNLALVLGLQGKYDEAKRLGPAAGSPETVAQNTEVIRKMVRLQPKAAPAPGAFSTDVVQAAPAPSNPAPALKPASIDTASTGTWQTNIAANQPSATLKGSAR